jgi:hypothetical protein
MSHSEDAPRDNPGTGIYAGGSSNPACQTANAEKVPVYVTFQAWYGIHGRWSNYPPITGSHQEADFVHSAGGACKCNDTVLSKYAKEVKRYGWPESCEEYDQRWRNPKWRAPNGDPGLMLYPPIGGPYDPADKTDMDALAKVMWDYCVSGVIIDYQAENIGSTLPTLMAILQIAKSMAKYKLRWAVMPDSMSVAWNDAVWQTMLQKFQENLTPEVLMYYMVIKGKKVLLPFTTFESPGTAVGTGGMQLPSKSFLQDPQNTAKNMFCGTSGKNCSFFLNTGWSWGARMGPTISHYKDYSGIEADQLGMFLWGPFMYPIGGNSKEAHPYEDPQQTLKLALDRKWSQNMYDKVLLNYVNSRSCGIDHSWLPAVLEYIFH